MSSSIAEPIQSRCAMLRYSRLTDAQILERLLDVCEKEEVILYALMIRYVLLFVGFIY